MGPSNNARLIEHNTAVVANAVNIVVLALGEVMGRQVQRQTGGNVISDEALTSLVTARIKNKLGL
jgi:hypothetical protein